METIGITLWFNNLTNTTSNVVKVDINSDNHEITPSVVIMRKTNQRIPVVGLFTKQWISTSQNCHCHENQENSDIQAQPREASGDMTTKFNAVSWTGHQDRKRTLGKN